MAAWVSSVTVTDAPPEHPPIRQIWGSEAPVQVRVRDIIRHPTSVKLMKYASVSIISTVVSQFVLFMVFGVLRLLPAVEANLVANVVATVPSYILNRRWVWGKGGKSHFMREVVPFWVLSFVGLAFSTLAVWAADSLAHHFGLSHAATSILVNAANLLSFGILWVVKFVAYEKIFHMAPVEHPEDQAEPVDA
jgi:putative flippase GtrA